MATVYSDDFTGTDGAALNARSMTGGAAWVDADSGFKIKSNGAEETVFVDWVNWHTAHIDTDLSSDAHWVQADCSFSTAGGSSAHMVGIVWRKHPTAGTKTFYTTNLRPTSTLYEVWKLVTGTFTSIASGGAAPTGAQVYVLYGESDSSNLMTVKFDTVTKYGPTTQADITGNYRTGITVNSQAGSALTHNWDNFSTGTFDAASRRRHMAFG